MRRNQEAYIRWKYSPELGLELYLENREEDDSRYDLNSTSSGEALEVKYSPSSSQVYSCRFGTGVEEDTDSIGAYYYKLRKVEMIPAVNWYPRAGSRLYGRFKLRYNFAEGRQYSNWQEEDREGSIFTWDISYDHRINKNVTLSLDYNGENYPKEKTHHEFKMEITAEF
jgi:hypothetical protein